MNPNASFDRQLEVILQRLETIRQQTGAAPGSQSSPVTEALEDLLCMLQELHLTGQELRRQNEKLDVTCQSAEAGRQHYQELFEVAPDGYLVTDAEGVIQEANYAAAILLNRDQDFLRGKPLVLFVAGEDRQYFSTHMTRLHEEVTTKVEDWEVQLRPNARPTFPATFAVTAVRDLEGRLTRLYWQFHDSTRRKQAEMALRESEQRFRMVADFTYDWDCWRNPMGDLLYISPSCERITGYHPNEFIADPNLLTAIAHPEDRARLVEHLLNEWGRSEAYSIDFRILTRNGEVRWIEHICQPVYDIDGTFLGRRSSNRDISKRKQAEAAMERYARRLEILRQLDQAILTTKSSGAIAKAALNHIQRLIPCQRASVLVFDFAAAKAGFLAVQMNGETELEEPPLLPLEMFKSIQDLQSGQPRQVEDILALPQLSRMDQLLRAKGLRAYLNVPLIAEGELLGTLNLALARPGLFTPEQVEIAREVAGQLAIAIRQANLRQQVQTYTGELERLVAERTAALQQERNFVSAVLDTANALMVVIDSQGRIVRFNRACEQTSGYTIDEVRNRRFWELFLPAEEMEGVKAVFDNGLCPGQFPGEFQHYWITRTDIRRLIFWSTTALYDQEGSVEYIIGVGIDITERKEAENAYQMLVEHSLQGLAIIQDLQVVFANPALARITGYTVDEMLSFSPEEARTLVYAKDQAVIWERATKRLMQEPVAPHYEFRFIRKDGQVRWLETYISPIQYRGKSAVQVAAIDLTERKEAEEALQRERDFAQSLIETAQVIILMLDPAGRIVHFNPYLEEISGYQLETVQGQDWFTTFLPAPDRERAHALFLQAIDDLPTQGKVNRIITRDGRTLEIEWYDKILKDIDGNTLGLLSVGHDVTEHNRAEVALRESEERYRRLFEDSPISIWEEDLSEVKKYIDQLRDEGIDDFKTFFDEHPEAVLECVARVKITDVNQATVELYEAERKEDLLGDLGLVFTETASNMFKAELIALAEGQTTFEGETTAKTLRGNERYIKLSLSVAPGHEEIWSKVLVSVIDLTRRKLAEDEKARLLEAVSQKSEQLHALTRQLAEVEEAERRELARELHDQVGSKLTALDFRLNTIQTYLAGQSLVAASIQPYLDDSLALVGETAECIRDVMANLRPPILDDYGLVAALRWYGDRFASWTGLTVTVQDEEPAPRWAVPLENALFRIAQEALNNVAKHARASEVTMTVAMDRGIIRLEVADNGVGFDPTLAANPASKQGWGLLSMTERAEMVGGRCRIESSPGQGTRVVVEVVE